MTASTLSLPAPGQGRAGPVRRPASSRRPAAREPRLGGRHDVVVPRDLGVRIPQSNRALLDRLRDRYAIDEAEVARTLLAAGMFIGLPLRDRVAAALYASGSMHLHAEFARVAAGMRTALARSCAAIARTTPPSPPRAPTTRRGSRDETLLRAKLGDLLHRRLRELVDIYIALRRDGEIPAARDEAERRLIEDLLARPAALVRRERSAVAEVARWALTAAEPDADEFFAGYVACRAAMWRRIDHAVAAMRELIERETGMALDEIG